MATRKISEFPSIIPAPTNRVLLENPGGAPTTSDGIGQTTLRDAVLAAGLTIPDLSDVNIPSTPPTGSVLSWNGSAWIAAAVAGAGLTYTMSTLPNDLTLSSSNTWYTTISRNLAEGTWFVVGILGFWRTTNGARTYYGRIVANTTTACVVQTYVPSANPSGATLTLATILNGGQTVSLQGATSSGSSADTIRANGTLDTSPWTRLICIKLA